MIKNYDHQEEQFAEWRSKSFKYFIQEEAVRKNKIQKHCYLIVDKVGVKIGTKATEIHIWQIGDQDAPEWEEMGFFENKAEWVKEITTWEFWKLEPTHRIKNLKARINASFTGKWYYNTHLGQKGTV